jgi:hypothetical protein
MIVLVRNRTLRGNEAARPPMENLISLLLVKEDFVLMTAGNKSSVTHLSIEWPERGRTPE